MNFKPPAYQLIFVLGDVIDIWKNISVITMFYNVRYNKQACAWIRYMNFTLNKYESFFYFSSLPKCCILINASYLTFESMNIYLNKYGLCSALHNLFLIAIKQCPLCQIIRWLHVCCYSVTTISWFYPENAEEWKVEYSMATPTDTQIPNIYIYIYILKILIINQANR